MNWTSVDKQMPETQHRVLVTWKNDYGKTRISCAEYIAPKSVLGEDFLDPEYSETFAEYDEEKDCYWTPDGFYESNYESDVNFFISDTVTHWMPLPQALETTASPSETAADKGILTEEELNKIDHMYGFGPDATFSKVINSHRELFRANAELSFKTMKIPALEADNKLLEETCEELEHKLSNQNEEICRMQDEISNLRGENNHE